jgi:hypothetical protein
MTEQSQMGEPLMIATATAECSTCRWAVFSSDAEFIETAIDRHIDANPDHVVTVPQEDDNESA